MTLQISKKTIGFASLFLLLMNPIFAQTEKTWTLQDCVEQALKSNITVQQQELQTKSIKADYNQSKLAMLPNLNGSLSNNWQTGFAINPETNSAQNNQSFRTNSVGLNSSMTLFNGFQNSNNTRLQLSNLKASEKELENTRNTITLNVCNAYLSVLQNIELRNSAISRVDATRAQVERQKKMFELGSSNKSRYLQLKAQLAQEELAFINSDNLVIQSYLELWLLIQVDPALNNKIAIPDTKNLEIADETRTVEQIYEDFSKKSPDVLAAQQRIRSAEIQKYMALGGRSPRITLGAGLNSFYTTQSKVGIGNPNFNNRTIGFWDNNGTLVQVYTPFPTYSSYETSSLRTQFDQNLGSNISLQLSLPIFNGWGVNTNIQKSQINNMNAKLNDQQIKNNLFRSISQSYTNFKSSRKKYEANQTNLEANKEAFDLADKQFELGAMNTADYLNSKNSLIRAEADFTQAKYELIFRRKVLDFYSGKELY
jgi:outer membrane protein